MRYWLMKSEPDCYSIDDLQRDGKDAWSGVRNYQARNYMRDDMHKGDQVLYYHSSTAIPGVVGVAEIVCEPYPDPTQFDATSEYFDPKSKPGAPTWVLVDVAYVRHFEQIVTLEAIKAHPLLAQMKVAQRGSRLSITPVEKAEFEEVCTHGRG